jgi:hypothetical protein
MGAVPGQARGRLLEAGLCIAARKSSAVCQWAMFTNWNSAPGMTA